MVTSTINADGATNVSINTKVGAFFTEAIDPLTITTTTFTLMQGTTPVAGTVSCVAFAATFTPTSSLTPNTLYTATLTTGVKDLAGNALASPYTWSWTTGAVPDITPPTVSSTIPPNGYTGVSINSAVAAIFSEAMDPSTVTSTTFILMQGTTLIPGTVSYLGVTAAFIPTTALAYNTVYTATINSGVKDLAGNAMVANYQWSFTTYDNSGSGGGTPSSAKAITSFSFVIPAVTGVINESAKTIAVTVPLGTNLTALVATFTTTGTGVKVGAAVQTSTATLNDFTNPVAYIVTAADASTVTYTVTVTVASNSAKAITAYSFASYTGAIGTINETAKTIAVTVPYGTPLTALVATFTTTGTGVKVGTTVQISLSTPNNFTNPVAYVVTAGDASTVTYTVTVTVASNSAKAITAYSFASYTGATGTINETAKTIAVTVPSGTPLTALVATFTTTGTGVKVGTTVQISAATPNDFTNPVAYIVTAGDASTATYTVTVTIGLPPNPTAPTLGTAGLFVILASQKVTTTGTTAVSNGDIGIIDQARSYYAGFTAGATPNSFTQLTNGLSYAHDDMPPFTYPSPYASTIAFLNQVRTDLGNAYTFLAADPNPTAPTQACPISLASLTLTRGVYKTASDVTLTGGNLTLDAQGDPNSVFIISIGGNLTTGSGGNIILKNGALAANVFFRVAGITVIGGGTSFYGNVFS